MIGESSGVGVVLFNAQIGLVMQQTVPPSVLDLDNLGTGGNRAVNVRGELGLEAFSV